MAFQLDAFQPDAFQSQASVVRPTVAHNGGRSQLNFWFPANGEFAFLNHMKNANWWVYGSSSQYALGPDEVNENGYPTVVRTPNMYSTVQLPTQAQRAGNYVLRWEGTATFVLALGGATLVSGSLSGTDGRAVIAPQSSGQVYIGLSSITSLTNIELVHVDDEALLDAGERWNPYFIGKLREANFGVLRFLDYQRSNTAMVTKWADRKPETYFSYKSTEYRNSIYAGRTTNSGNDYSATLSGFSLTNMAMVIVQFNADASGTSTLNVSGTGAKEIKWANGRTITAGLPELRPRIDKFGLLVYDADLDAWLKYGGDFSLFDRGLENGWPYEVMVDLCNEVGAHPWFVQPFLANDTNDFIEGLATYCNGYLGDGLIPRFEGCNETPWNTANGFYGSQYFPLKETAVWGSSYSGYEWYGRSLSKMGEAISGVFGGDRTKYQVICGGQTYGTPSVSNPKMEAGQYVADGGTPASDWVTHVAITNYWGARHADTATQTAYATEWASATEERKAEIIEQYLTEEQDVNVAFTREAMRVKWAAWKTWADGYGVALTAYEGGYSPDYGTYTGDVLAFRKASKAAPILESLTTLVYETVLNEGGEFPSCYMFSGANQAWSVFDPTIYDEPSPQWDAIVTFNNPVTEEEEPSGGRRIRRRKPLQVVWPTLDELREEQERLAQQARDVAQKIAKLQEKLPTAKVREQSNRLQKRLDELDSMIEEQSDMEMVLLLAEIDD